MKTHINIRIVHIISLIIVVIGCFTLVSGINNLVFLGKGMGVLVKGLIFVLVGILLFVVLGDVKSNFVKEDLSNAKSVKYWSRDFLEGNIEPNLKLLSTAYYEENLRYEGLRNQYQICKEEVIMSLCSCAFFLILAVIIPHILIWIMVFFSFIWLCKTLFMLWVIAMLRWQRKWLDFSTLNRSVCRNMKVKYYLSNIS